MIKNMNKIIDKLRLLLKNYKITNMLYDFIKDIYYRIYIFENKNRFFSAEQKFSNINIKDIELTLRILINSNKSISRFGDGELLWILGSNSGLNTFEKSSSELSHMLLKVLNSKNNNLMIGLPNQFVSLHNYSYNTKRYWIRFMVKNTNKIMPYLSSARTYYNADFTRPYMDFINKKDSGFVFSLVKKIWNDKDILIIEGNQSRIGVKDSLLDNARCVRRIECPSKNAFEVIDDILKAAISFLNNNKNYMSLISLGPTATVLAYDLCNYGFRAIDIGNIDVEFNWYKLGVNHKVNLPYKYVNELIHGQNALPLNTDKKYQKEIVNNILKN